MQVTGTACRGAIQAVGKPQAALATSEAGTDRPKVGSAVSGSDSIAYTAIKGTS